MKPYRYFVNRSKISFLKRYKVKTIIENIQPSKDQTVILSDAEIKKLPYSQLMWYVEGLPENQRKEPVEIWNKYDRLKDLEVKSTHSVRSFKSNTK